eukprot:1149432-Pelagomonas_calceolata.AAC.1
MNPHALLTSPSELGGVDLCEQTQWCLPTCLQVYEGKAPEAALRQLEAYLRTQVGLSGRTCWNGCSPAKHCTVTNGHTVPVTVTLAGRCCGLAA